MNKQGYRVMSLKGEVVEEIRKRAKEEDKTLSMYLVSLIESEGERKGKASILNRIFRSEGLTREDLKEEISRIKEELRDGKEGMVTEEVLRKVVSEEIKKALKEVSGTKESGSKGLKKEVEVVKPVLEEKKIRTDQSFEVPKELKQEALQEEKEIKEVNDKYSLFKPPPPPKPKPKMPPTRSY